MNTYLLSAGILCFILGLIHSILGEYLIFNRKRIKGHFIPSLGSKALPEGHLRIVWATWHLASFFGWCLGIIIIKIASIQHTMEVVWIDFLLQSISISMIAGAVLVLLATKGKHPGWIVLLIIGILLILG